MNRKHVAQQWMRLAALCLAGLSQGGFAQTPPPVILSVDLEN
jgi:hypothetical protein